MATYAVLKGKAMASLSQHHQSLNNGVGKCSVPMWMGGCPAGFCDEPAYGKQLPNQTVYGDYGPGYRGGRWLAGGVFTPGYCSGLACPNHGGPQQTDQKGSEQ